MSDERSGGGAPPLVILREPGGAGVTSPCGGGVSPDVVAIRFEIANADGLDATVEWVRLDERREEVGPRRLATPYPGGDATADIPGDTVILFLWDAGRDLGGDSATVQLIVTPVGGNGPMESLLERTGPFRAGNTGPSAKNVRLLTSGTRVDVLFDVVDEEADTVCLTRVEVAVSEKPCEEQILEELTFEDLAAEAALTLRHDYPSAPEAERRLTGNFGFDVTVPEGFFGSVAVRFELVDFPGEEPHMSQGCAELDTNDPPTLTLLPVVPEQLWSGIVPVRFTLSDPDGNPASVEVLVNLQDGRGFLPAHELPSKASDGTAGLETGDRSRVFTFLWDALSQARGDENATIQVRAYNENESERVSVGEQEVKLALSWLEEVRALPVGLTPGALTSADYDGDGFLDVAVASEGSRTVSLLRGGAEGLLVFGQPIEIGAAPVAVASGTFEDGDGPRLPDVVVASKAPSKVTLLKGTPDGLVWVGEIELVAESKPVALGAGDFDGDAVDDAIVASDGSQDVVHLRGRPGGLDLHERIPLGARPVALRAARRDADGVSYVVLATKSIDPKDPDRLVCLRGGRDGLLEVGRVLTGGDDPLSLTLGDHDLDGLVDAVVAHQSSRSITFLAGRGPCFAEGIPVLEGDQPEGVTSADFDGDGVPDVLATDRGSHSAALLRGKGGGRPAHAPGDTIPVGRDPLAVVAGDHDGDGFPDAATANFGSATVTYLRGGREGLARVADVKAGAGPRALLRGDYNGDRVDDLAVANASSGSVTFLRGGTGGPVLQEPPIDVGSGPSAVSSGFYDDDRYLDAVVANQGSVQVTYLRGGPGGLTRVREIETKESPRPAGLASGDFDDDGYGDVLVVSAPRDSSRATLLKGGPAGPTYSRSFGVPAAGFHTTPPILSSGRFGDDRFGDVLMEKLGSASLLLLKGGADPLKESYSI